MYGYVMATYKISRFYSLAICKLDFHKNTVTVGMIGPVETSNRTEYSLCNVRTVKLYVDKQGRQYFHREGKVYYVYTFQKSIESYKIPIVNSKDLVKDVNTVKTVEGLFF